MEFRERTLTVRVKPDSVDPATTAQLSEMHAARNRIEKQWHRFLTEHDVFLSPVSLWEIAVKVSNGKWQMNQSFEIFLDRCLNQYEFQMLPIEPSHTIAVSRLPFPTEHRDPFDRMLISQALVESMALVSVDSAFDAYGVTRIW